MSSTSDRTQGKSNEAAGKGKQFLGEMSDDEKLKTKGKGQETQGKGQSVKGKLKDKMKKH